MAPKDVCAGVKISTGFSNIHITMTACVSTSGLALQPTLILPLKEFPAHCVELANWFHRSGQEAGWIIEDVFCEWVLNVFIPHVQSEHAMLQLAPYEPALLLLVRHSSRGCVRALTAMRDVEIVARLYFHTLLICVSHWIGVCLGYLRRQ